MPGIFALRLIFLRNFHACVEVACKPQCTQYRARLAYVSKPEFRCDLMPQKRSAADAYVINRRIDRYRDVGSIQS